MRDIDKMSEEAKKNCVVFCAGCHNFKEQDDMYKIPLNKLQNQLMYDEGDEHVTGRELVMDFDLIVVSLVGRKGDMRVWLTVWLLLLTTTL